jgi:hypothetical protein
MHLCLINPEKYRSQVNLKHAGCVGFAAAACHETQNPFAQIFAGGYRYASSISPGLVYRAIVFLYVYKSATSQCVHAQLSWALI